MLRERADDDQILEGPKKRWGLNKLAVVLVAALIRLQGKRQKQKADQCGGRRQPGKESGPAG